MPDRIRTDDLQLGKLNAYDRPPLRAKGLRRSLNPLGRGCNGLRARTCTPLHGPVIDLISLEPCVREGQEYDGRMSRDEQPPSHSPRRGPPTLVGVHAQGTSCLALQYSDGTTGTVDISNELAAGGVFEPLRDPVAFAQARLGEFGQVEWPGGVELCADAMYLRLVGKSPEEVFPGLTRQQADA